MTRSAILEEILRETASRPRDASVAYVVEQPDSGIRRRVEVIAEAVGGPDLPPLTGLSATDWKGRVLINVDTYTRPESGHFPNLTAFTNDSYLAGRRTAIALFSWGKKLKKS